MDQDQSFIEDRYKQEDVDKSLVRKYYYFLAKDLSDIITKYINYEPEAVKAALYVSVERGLISFDLKEHLWAQIEENFNAHKRHIKKHTWEKNNAFIKYVSAYTNEEIYDIIDDPKGIVIDVYFAVLVTAKEKELISEEDCQRYYENAKLGIRTEDEILKDEIESFFGTNDPADLFESEAELEAEKEKFWKCPICNQLVSMEFGVCWNCQSDIPAVVEHPDRQEIINEKRSKTTYSPFKAGLYLIVFGSMIALFEQFRPFYSDFANKTRFIGVGFGVFFALVGVVVVIIGLFIRSKSDDAFTT